MAAGSGLDVVTVPAHRPKPAMSKPIATPKRPEPETKQPEPRRTKKIEGVVKHGMRKQQPRLSVVESASVRSRVSHADSKPSEDSQQSPHSLIPKRRAISSRSPRAVSPPERRNSMDAWNNDEEAAQNAEESLLHSTLNASWGSVREANLVEEEAKSLSHLEATDSGEDVDEVLGLLNDSYQTQQKAILSRTASRDRTQLEEWITDDFQGQKDEITPALASSQKNLRVGGVVRVSSKLSPLRGGSPTLRLQRAAAWEGYEGHRPDRPLTAHGTAAGLSMQPTSSAVGSRAPATAVPRFHSHAGEGQGNDTGHEYEDGSVGHGRECAEFSVRVEDEDREAREELQSRRASEWSSYEGQSLERPVTGEGRSLVSGGVLPGRPAVAASA